ncbi:hypothetical protein M3Y14_29105 [Bacillus thuringiensis]|uniref:hypothetical protein n=1 Tax=Bacillus thuringiensis TaxID=1428 RepID=UPI00222487DE|nr:hypothetical protein [Bacillus thuringiensis]UYX52410.1 hypothetical protein M3Y14_29105 [Bacillus thuringiensis]
MDMKDFTFSELKGKLRSFVDSIFNPFHSFLDLGLEKLRALNQVTSQGIDIGKYFSVFGDMPGAWQGVIVSALLSATLLGGLIIFRSIMRIYYSAKEGVKWW